MGRGKIWEGIWWGGIGHNGMDAGWDRVEG